MRPTSDRLRETLFNVVQARCEGSVWVDAFSGTGAVGLEALSRGADFVYLVESNLDAQAVIRKNLELCGVESGFRLIGRPFEEFAAKPIDRRVDFIFLDPPYDFRDYGSLLNLTTSSALRHSGTCLILELFKKTPLDFLPAGLTLVRTLKAGDSRLLLLRMSPDEYGQHNS